jgi:hypothetical protein
MERGSHQPRSPCVRGSRPGRLRATWDELAGVILDPEQAMAVLKGHAGITVRPAGVESES